MLEGELTGDIEVVGYRSWGLERIVPDAEHSGDIAADCVRGGASRGYRSGGL